MTIIPINYNQFMNSKRILHSDYVDNFSDGIKFYIQNANIADIISYNTETKLELYNYPILQKDNNDNYFIEHTYDRKADVIDNITFYSSNKNVSLSFIIGNNEYKSDEIKEYVTISSQYNDFKFKFVFLEEPSMDDYIVINYKNYLINSNDRKMVAGSEVITDTNRYSGGVVY